MALSENKRNEYMRRLLLSRMRILSGNGFYGLLLMHMTYSIDETCETAATDGRRIFFGPDFLDSISDPELDFVLMHEIMHVVLRHCLRQGERHGVIFNAACDIVVNSNILLSKDMDYSAITLAKYGESMHLAPDGSEGAEYTAEEVYDMLVSSAKNSRGNTPNPKGKGISSMNGKSGSKSQCSPDLQGNMSGANKAHDNCQSHSSSEYSGNNSPVWDDHTRWGSLKDDETLKDEWEKHLLEACEAISVRDPSNQRGSIPAFAKRMLDELKKSVTDWRTVLNDFIQEEITDYSFTPPDKRFDGSSFFLPDFNEADDTVNNILFMIDTSASMSDNQITAAYSEIKGAIDQFNGRLRGWLGFFDAAVTEPVPFTDESEFRAIKPYGGGGTSFAPIFEYVHKHMQDNPPTNIIILTDGFAPYPKEEISNNIPVLWMINNEQITPPWGKIARIYDKQGNY